MDDNALAHERLGVQRRVRRGMTAQGRGGSDDALDRAGAVAGRFDLAAQALVGEVCANRSDAFVEVHVKSPATGLRGQRDSAP